MARNTRRLTRRDIEVFARLLERRVDTIGNLHQACFSDWTYKSTRTKFARLTNGGFIEKHELPDLPARLRGPSDQRTDGITVAYTLTARGIEALRRRSVHGEHLRGRRIRAVHDTSLPHELAVAHVGDQLGVSLIGDHLRRAGRGQGRHRPDAAYRAANPQGGGRNLVLVEVDLGHYRRDRIAAKGKAFLEDPEAQGALFVVATDERAAWVMRALADAHGERMLDRVQVLTFADLHDPDALQDDLRPERPQDPGALALDAEDRLREAS